MAKGEEETARKLALLGASLSLFKQLKRLLCCHV
jgi:hypothetical protein